MSKEVVDEIMGLVEYYNGATKFGTYEQQIAAREAVESKLRKSVENKFSVREPLSDEELLKMNCVSLDCEESTNALFVDRSTLIKYARAIERAHGIFEEN